MGRQFAWLWASYAVSTFGTRLAFDAFPLIAILVLHAGPTQVSLLAAAGLAVGAVVAIPLGPWVEFRRKRPVMVAMDLIRFAALMTIPAAFALGRLSFVQLVVVAVIVAAADIAFMAAGGACLKAIVRPADLLVANGRFESTAWTATALGPPIGGAAVGLFGPVVTVVADAVSYLLSAVGIRAIGGKEVPPERADAPRPRAGELLEGWRYILAHPTLRPLLFNTILVSGLIMASSPLVAVLMLGDLGFTPWEYGLAFALPCVGGLIGARLSRGVVERFGRHRVMRTAGTLRACWLVGLAFIHPGVTGLVFVIGVEFGLITCMGVFNPVFATYRLDQLPADRIARTLSAWSITSKATTAAMTALWGLLAGVTSPRTAIAVAGLVMLALRCCCPGTTTRRLEGTRNRNSIEQMQVPPLPLTPILSSLPRQPHRGRRPLPPQPSPPIRGKHINHPVTQRQQPALREGHARLSAQEAHGFRSSHASIMPRSTKDRLTSTALEAARS